MKIWKQDTYEIHKVLVTIHRDLTRVLRSHYVQKSHCFFTKQDAYEIHKVLLTGILLGSQDLAQGYIWKLS